jgi:Tfp pilus assembly protein PilF
MSGARALASRVAALLTGLLLAGCATTSIPLLHQPSGAPVTAGDFADSTEAELRVTNAISLLELASPAALAEAAAILSAADLEGVGRVARAQALGKALWDRLYPGRDNPFPSATVPSLEGAASLSRLFTLLAGGLPLLEPAAQAPDGAPRDGRAAADSLSVDLAAASDLSPRSVLPPYLRGLLSLRAGTPDARPFFEEALRRLPDFPPAARELAALIVGGGTAAAEWETVQRCAALLPTPAERFATLAGAALAAGRPDDAADAAARALLAAPDRADLVLLRARALEAQGNWYQALWIAEAVTRTAPAEPGAWLMRARLQFEQGKDDAAALAALDEGERAFPAEAGFAHLRGRILVSEGRTADGVAELRRALTIRPDRVETLSLLLRVSVEAADWPGARSWLARIPEARRSADDLRMAWRVAAAESAAEEALGYARALRARDGGAETLRMEAVSLLALGRKAEARAVLDEAITRPAEAAARGVLYFLRSTADSDDPLRDLRAALRENPDNREALLAIVDLLARGGESRKALEYARHAAALSPGDASLAALVKDLARRVAAGD